MDQWQIDFDAELRRHFAIDSADAGLDDEALSRYRDLDPKEAALTFGDDYDLTRVDQGWR